MGPFFLFPGTRFRKALWYGRPVDVTVDIALAQVGSMQIELISSAARAHWSTPKRSSQAPPRGITLALSPMICIQSALAAVDIRHPAGGR